MSDILQSPADLSSKLIINLLNNFHKAEAKSVLSNDIIQQNASLSSFTNAQPKPVKIQATSNLDPNRAKQYSKTNKSSKHQKPNTCQASELKKEYTSKETEFAKHLNFFFLPHNITEQQHKLWQYRWALSDDTTITEPLISNF